MRTRTPILAAVCLALVAAGAAAKTTKTVQVDCDKGESIGAALEWKADQLVIEFSGRCAEDIEIWRSDVTLRGAGAEAVLLGSGPDDPPRPTLLVEGVERVALEDFEVQGSDDNGIEFNAALGSVSNLQIEDSAAMGLVVRRGSHVEMADIASVGNGGYGIRLSSSSGLVMSGAVELRDNARIGLYVARSSSVRPHHEEALALVVSGSQRGIRVQEGGTVVLSNPPGVEIVARSNGVAVSVLNGDFFSHHLEASDNWQALYVQDPQSSLWVFNATISGNSFGLVSYRGNAALNDSTVTANSIGLWLDGGTARLGTTVSQGNIDIDLGAEFGAAIDFFSGNDIGSIFCDGTVLWRGDPGCPDSAPLQSFAQPQMSRIEAVVLHPEQP